MTCKVHHRVLHFQQEDVLLTGLIQLRPTCQDRISQLQKQAQMANLTGRSLLIKIIAFQLIIAKRGGIAQHGAHQVFELDAAFQYFLTDQ